MNCKLSNGADYFYVNHIKTLFFDFIFFPVALRSNACHGLLTLEVSRSQTTTHHTR